MNKPKIRITLVEQKGTMGCHRGYKVGDSYDFDTERGNLCPMAMHVAFPYVDILLMCSQRDKDYCELQFMERTSEFRGVLFICCNSLEDKS